MMNIKEHRLTKEWPYHVSCGGIIYRLKDKEVEVLLLVHHDGSHDTPKGTLHYGETLEQCALREAEEESGQKGEVIGYLGGRLDEGTDKKSGATLSKITHYFAIKWISDTGVHDDEYDHTEWVPTQDATGMLRPSSAEVVNRLIQFADIFPDKI